RRLGRLVRTVRLHSEASALEQADLQGGIRTGQGEGTVSLRVINQLVECAQTLEQPREAALGRAEDLYLPVFGPLGGVPVLAAVERLGPVAGVIAVRARLGETFLVEPLVAADGCACLPVPDLVADVAGDEEGDGRDCTHEQLHVSSPSYGSTPMSNPESSPPTVNQ